jgi:hypothetical protein
MNQRQRVIACAAAMVLVCGCGGVTKTEAGSAGASGAPSSSAGSGAGGSTAGDAEAGGDAGTRGDAGVADDAGMDGEDRVPADISGTWKGYVENYSFRDTSDAITLRIVSGPNGITGHATFGMSPLPPPVTNPTIGYPPGVDPDPTAAYPGFPFTIENASLEGSRLRFGISPAEMWKRWCEAQIPIADEANVGSYGCARNWATKYGVPCSQFDPATMHWVQADCGRVRLCFPGSVCQCMAKACSVSLRGGIHFKLDISLPKADGSVSGLGGYLHNVHLTKG